MDLTPLVPAGRQVIESYGPGRFRVSGVVWRGPILVRPTRTVAWPDGGLAAVTADGLRPLLEPDGSVTVLLVGCGARAAMLPGSVRTMLKAQLGCAVEAMDTGAACRTYAVLMAEDRSVAAALLPL